MHKAPQKRRPTLYLHVVPSEDSLLEETERARRGLHEVHIVVGALQCVLERLLIRSSRRVGGRHRGRREFKVRFEQRSPTRAHPSGFALVVPGASTMAYGETLPDHTLRDMAVNCADDMYAMFAAVADSNHERYWT